MRNHPTQNHKRPWVVGAIVALGAVILAVEPVLWLVQTWTAPAYDSPGGWIFALTAGIFAWSVSSRQTEYSSTRHAWWLLAGTAVLRLVGQVLAINVLGALALAVDVYAVGVLGGLGKRERAVSPLWLAVLFAFSLPVERIFQRVIGYGLQHVSAAGSCSLLGTVFDDVTCAGVHIQLAGQDVLVDLPCSGARGLVLLSVLFCGLAALARPNVRQAVVGVSLAVVSALVANSVRIASLAVGIAFPDAVGVDVMAQPWHDIVGLAALGFGVMPLVWWARVVGEMSGPLRSRKQRETTSLRPEQRPGEGDCSSEPRPLRAIPLPGALSSARGGAERSEAEGPRQKARDFKKAPAFAFLFITLAVIFAPQKPVDVAKRLDPIALPSTLGGHPAARQPLSDLEQDYFTRFGGAAAKASYGPHTLLVVRTSAPLRHLHAPDECLSGAGFTVETSGITGHALPGATYRATAPNGSEWRVVVTYVSDAGEVATSVSEAVWRWMQDTDSTWTAIERIHPAHAPLAEAEAFDRTVARAFDLASQEPRTKNQELKTKQTLPATWRHTSEH